MESWWWTKRLTILITNLSSQRESNFTQNTPGPIASAVVLSVKPSPQELANIKGTPLIGQMVTSRHWVSVMFSSLISVPLFSLLQPSSSCWSRPCGCCCYGQKRRVTQSRGSQQCSSLSCWSSVPSQEVLSWWALWWRNTTGGEMKRSET